MGTVKDKLELLLTTKLSIRDAIISKGQAVAGTDPFSSYAEKIAAIQTGVDTSDATAGAGDILSGKTAYVDGKKITGSIPGRGAADLTASGAAVTAPTGYYPSQVTKKVAEAAQATPSITIGSNGLITASVSQGEGYVAAGTRSATRQLTTQVGKTVTPGTSLQTAVASGRYTTGTVYVAGDANLAAGNIKKGVSIFGVAGSYEGEGNYYATTVVTTPGSKNLITLYPGFVVNNISLVAFGNIVILQNLLTNGSALFAMNFKKNVQYAQVLQLNYNPNAGGYIMIGADATGLSITLNGNPSGPILIGPGDYSTWASDKYVVTIT